MATWQKVLLGIVGVLAVLIVGIVVFLKSIDLNHYKGRMSAVASEQLGEKVNVTGDFKFHFGSSIYVEVNQAAITPVDGKKAPILKVDHARVALSLWSFFVKTIHVQDIDIHDVLFQLSSKQGKTSTPEKSAPKEKKSSGSASFSWNVIVDQAALHNIHVKLGDLSNAQKRMDIALNTLTFHIDSKKGVFSKMDAVFNGYPIKWNGSITYRPSDKGKLLHADWDGNIAGMILALKGDIKSQTGKPLQALINQKLGKLEGTHLQFGLFSKDVLNLAKMLHVSTKGIAAFPLNVMLDVKGYDDHLALDNIVVHAGRDSLLKMDLEGSVKNLDKGSKVQLSGDVKATSTRPIAEDLAKMGIKSIPLIAPLNISFKVSDKKKKEWMTHVTFQAGKSKGKIDTEADLDHKIPHIKTSLNASLIDINDFTKTLASHGKKATKPKKGKSAPKGHSVYPAGTISLDALKELHVELKADIKRLQRGSGGLNNVKANIKIEDGVLKIKNVSIGQKILHMVGNVDSNGNKISLKMTSQNLPLGSVLTLAGMPPYLSAPMTSDINLQTKGHSVKDFARFLNGKVNLDVGSGQMDFSSLTHKFSGVFGNLLVGHGAGKAPLYCFISQNTFTDGNVHSAGSIFDSGISTLLLKGEAHLGNERLNFQMLPVRVVGSTQATIPVAISGLFIKPKVKINVQNAAAYAANLFLKGGADATSRAKQFFPKDFHVSQSNSGCRYVYSKYAEQHKGSGVAGKVSDLKKNATKKLNDTINKGLDSLLG